MTVDPARFASGAVSLYGYVRNNPVNVIDAAGLVVTDCDVCMNTIGYLVALECAAPFARVPALTWKWVGGGLAGTSCSNWLSSVVCSFACEKPYPLRAPLSNPPDNDDDLPPGYSGNICMDPPDASVDPHADASL